MSLNDIYRKQYEKQQMDKENGDIRLLMEQLKRENEERVEFKEKNLHRTKYQQVKNTYSVIYGTQSRFELLFKIIEAQQKIITTLQHAT